MHSSSTKGDLWIKALSLDRSNFPTKGSADRGTKCGISKEQERQWLVVAAAMDTPDQL
jgi:hypothetical protein